MKITNTCIANFHLFVVFYGYFTKYTLHLLSRSAIQATLIDKHILYIKIANLLF